MIALALDNLWLLGAALLIGIVTARWAFGRKQAAAAAARPETGKEDAAP